jgi:Hemerythrin HHE cation binding domain
MTRMSTSTGEEVMRSFVRHEHSDLVAGIEHIHAAGCELASLPADRMSSRVLEVSDWIERVLKPHMVWEETWLLPQVDHRSHTPWLARLVRFDHRQIASRAEALSSDRVRLMHGPERDATTDTRCDLFAIEALLRAHLEREEQFLLPLLGSE